MNLREQLYLYLEKTAAPGMVMPASIDDVQKRARGIYTMAGQASGTMKNSFGQDGYAAAAPVRRKITQDVVAPFKAIGEYMRPR